MKLVKKVGGRFHSILKHEELSEISAKKMSDCVISDGILLDFITNTTNASAIFSVRNFTNRILILTLPM